MKGITPKRADEPEKGGGRVRGCMRWALYLFLGFIGLAVLSAILGGGEEESGAEVAPTFTQTAVVSEGPTATEEPVAAAVEVATATPVAVPSDTATVAAPTAAGLVLEPSATPAGPGATDTATVVPSATPTDLPTATWTPSPEPTATAVAVIGVVNQAANLRGGPGATFDVVGSAAVGDVVEVVGQNEAGDWLELSSGAWVAAFLVGDAPAGAEVSAEVEVSEPSSPEELAAYASQVAPLLEGYSEGLTTISVQANLAAANPALMLSEDWKLQMALAMVLVQLSNEGLRGLTPPGDLVPVHTLMLGASDHFELSMLAFADGIDNFDADSIELAIAEMLAGSKLIEEASDTLEFFLSGASVVSILK